MTDIVEQGRLYIRAEAPDYYEKTVVWKMADEIERLREMVKWFACHCEGACDRSDQNCLISQAALEEKE